jgi:hypothetical protein
MNDNVKYGFIGFILGIILFSGINFVLDTNKSVGNSVITITRPAERIVMPNDTFYIHDTLRRPYKVSIKEPTDSTFAKDLIVCIDSLNKLLLARNIDRIATLDTTYKPYNDRFLIYHSVVSNDWRMSVFYKERKVRDSISFIYVPIEKKYSNDFEKFVAESPYLSIISSLVVGYTFGKIK